MYESILPQQNCVQYGSFKCIVLFCPRVIDDWCIQIMNVITVYAALDVIKYRQEKGQRNLIFLSKRWWGDSLPNHRNVTYSVFVHITQEFAFWLHLCCHGFVLFTVHIMYIWMPAFCFNANKSKMFYKHVLLSDHVPLQWPLVRGAEA